MTLEELISLAPEIVPLLPRIEKAVSTIERIVSDPDVKDAIAVGQQLLAIVEKAQQTPT